MKKIIKKIELKPILIAIGLLIFQCILYWLSKTISGEPNLIGGEIDKRIPFNIYFVIPYVFWYFMLILIPYYIYKKDKNLFTKYVITNLIVTTLANIIFVIYPTTVDRPIVEGTNIIELITRLIFYVDTPIENCFPSLHCAYSMLWLLFISICKNTKKWFQIIVILTSLTIMAATMLIKQHVFIDFISGDLIALIVFLIIYKDKKLTNKFKKILKIT